MNDLTAFVREHRSLTAAFLLTNLFAAFLLVGHGAVRLAVALLGFSLSFVWFLVFSALSLWRSYERSRS